MEASTGRRREWAKVPPRKLTLSIYDHELGERVQVTDPARIAEAYDNIKLPPWGRQLLISARRRSMKHGMPCTLTAIDIHHLIIKADGKCAVTGIPFDFARSAGHFRRPFAASLDRIDGKKGYTPKNVRLVCIAVNMAMSEWGEAVFWKIVEAAKSGRSYRRHA